jgi:hypothetical protein
MSRSYCGSMPLFIAIMIIDLQQKEKEMYFGKKNYHAIKEQL